METKRVVLGGWEGSSLQLSLLQNLRSILLHRAPSQSPFPLRFYFLSPLCSIFFFFLSILKKELRLYPLPPASRFYRDSAMGSPSKRNFKGGPSPHRFFSATRTTETCLARISQLTLVFLLGAASAGFVLLNTTRTSNKELQKISPPCSGSLGIRQWINGPPNLKHRMMEEELLWRASFVPQRTGLPFRRIPRIAFMFLCVGPLPLYPLWEKFLKGHENLYAIYIHSSPSYKPSFPSSSPFYRRQILSKKSRWGDSSLFEAERRLLANALLDLSNERFVLLSETCIPLFGFTTIYGYLMKSKQSFVNSFTDPGPDGRGRYSPAMAPEVTLEQWRKGSQWFEVDRRAAISIIKDKKFYPKFKQFCKPPCYIDEHYLPIMLSIEAPGLIANRSITWADWSRSGSHPAKLGAGNVTGEFFRQIRGQRNCSYNGRSAQICFIFARKFSPESLQPLLQLAPSLFS